MNEPGSLFNLHVHSIEHASVNASRYANVVSQHTELLVVRESMCKRICLSCHSQLINALTKYVDFTFGHTVSYEAIYNVRPV